MKNIAIVEDNDNFAGIIIDYINQYMKENNEELNIIRFNNADDFLKDYQQIYSVILMDIQMPGIDGMNASFEIRKIDKTVSIIFESILSIATPCIYMLSSIKKKG